MLHNMVQNESDSTMTYSNRNLAKIGHLENEIGTNEYLTIESSAYVLEEDWPVCSDTLLAGAKAGSC